MTRDATDELKGRVARHWAAPEWFTTFEQDTVATVGDFVSEDDE